MFAVKWATFCETLEWHHLRHICAIKNEKKKTLLLIFPKTKTTQMFLGINEFIHLTKSSKKIKLKKEIIMILKSMHEKSTRFQVEQKNDSHPSVPNPVAHLTIRQIPPAGEERNIETYIKAELGINE